MSLKPIESKDLRTFFKTGSFSPGQYTYGSQLSGVGFDNAITYYDRLDVLVMLGEQWLFPAPNKEIHLSFDPLGIDNTSPVSRQGDVIAGNRGSIYCVGEWDKVANTQALYTGNTTSLQFWPMNIVDFTIDNSVNLWPFAWTTGFGGSGGPIGGWDQGTTGQGNFAFFETWGYAIRGCAFVKHTDGTPYHGLAQIDLSNGKATLLNVPTRYTTFPAALFEAPQFNGDSFTLGRARFVQDDDSLPAAPKGRLFLGQSQYLGDGAVPNSNNRYYMKVIDWNPLGVAAAPGTPSRIHLRELLLTRLNFIQQQPFGTNLNSAGDAVDGGSPSPQNTPAFYHPPSRTFVTYTDWKWTTFENERGITRHSITPELDQIEPPTAQAEVETNKTVTFKSRGLGDLGEPVAGIPAIWALARRSTIDEQLDTSAAPVANIVAHPPIDDDSEVVKLSGTPLTKGVDYTIVYSTGTITWIGAQSPPAASGYTVSYNHSNTSATPPHGSLLQETTDTDEEGVAESRVQYADDDELANQLDRITVVMSDD